MALFTVTDKAIKEYVSQILSDSPLVSQQVVYVVKDWLERFGIDLNADRAFEADERYAIIALLNSIVAPGDGKIVPAEFALQASMNFQEYHGTPAHIIVPDGVVKEFLGHVHDRKKILIDNGAWKKYEMAFRLYFGHEKQGPKHLYSIVMVPICTRLLTEAGQKRDYKLDLEDLPLSASGGFFALILRNGNAKISTDPCECGEITKSKDHGSEKELAFCTLEMFDKFRNGTDSTKRHTMGVTMGRLIEDGNPITKNDPVTQIISFRDAKGEILQSKFEADKVVFDGFCFDQSDLIPPPFPIPDKSF
jgi:hypothetical protein